ncbi:MAG: hypothetical protein IT445_02295 [Phycisphaeraceae bacterium]|nr:hypothetical protein [Phycisphaeraceae bacterium]
MRTIMSITCLLIVSATASAQEQAVDLRPRLAAGQASTYEFWTRRDQTATQQMLGNERSVKMHETVTGQISWRVDKLRSDGSADCTMTFEWIAAEFEVEGSQTGKADSRKGGGDWEQGDAFVKAMAGKPISVQVEADGSIGKVTGFAPINKALGGDKDTYDEADFQEAASYLATLIAAPAEAAVDATWSVSPTWNHDMGKLELSTTYKLDDVGDLAGVPVAMISGESKVKLEFEKPDLGADGPKVDMKQDAGQRFEQVVFDLSRGEAAARNITQTLRTTVTINLPNGSLVQKQEETVQDQLVRVEEE